MARMIRIESGGETVQLNGFSGRVVLNTMLGLLGSLRGVDTREEIRITIGAEEEGKRV